MIIFNKHFLERVEQRSLNLQDIKDILNDQNINFGAKLLQSFSISDNFIFMSSPSLEKFLLP
jgi:hypothetical protein